MKKYMIVVVIGACMFIGCRDRKSDSQGNIFPGSCPYLTKDTKGNPVLCWAGKADDSVSTLCYAISVDGGQTFGKPVTIPGSDNLKPHAENLAKMIFKPSGEIIALWGSDNSNEKNKYAGSIFFSQSFDNGESWSKPRLLVEDTTGYDQRYYDIALLPDGEAAIIWLDNRNVSGQGSSLYFSTTKADHGFVNERMIGRQCCQCCRTSLFVDSKAGIHLLYRGIINDSIRDMVHRSSVDGGKNFSTPKQISRDNWVIDGCPHTGPAMTENKEGLHFAWFTGGSSKGCYYANSDNNGNTFAPRDHVSNLGSHPQITTLANGKLVIAWDEFTKAGDRFYKRIAVQQRSSQGRFEKQGFITPDSLTATYPVLESLSNNRVLIAYTARINDRDYISYKVIGL